MAQNGGGGPPPPRHHHRHLPGSRTFGPPEAGSGTTTTTHNAPSPALLLPFFPTASSMSTSNSASHQRQQDMNRDFISLAQPRPGIARVRNEYIETPLRPPLQQQQQPQLHLNHNHPLLHSLSSSSSTSSTSSSNGSSFLLMSKGAPTTPKTSSLSNRSSNPVAVHQRNNSNSNANSIRELIQLPQSRTTTTTTTIVSSQTSSPTRILIGFAPTSTASKRKGDDVGSLKGTDVRTLLPLTRTRSSASTTADSLRSQQPLQDPAGPHDDSSIICRECNRCKCAACGSPRPLPATWICKDKYQCSAETLVDQCSCMCCVKAVFYHAAKDHEMDDDVSCADRPCSCTPHRRCSRWACVGLLTALMPCLLCYWPLRGCLRLCELCYTKYNNRHACQCAASTRKSSSSAVLVDQADQSRRRKVIGDSACSPTSPTSDNAITVAPSSKRLLHDHDHHRHH